MYFIFKLKKEHIVFFRSIIFAKLITYLLYLKHLTKHIPYFCTIITALLNKFILSFHKLFLTNYTNKTKQPNNVGIYFMIANYFTINNEFNYLHQLTKQINDLLFIFFTILVRTVGIETINSLLNNN